MHQKDTMWYIKTWAEAISIFVFLACLIGFVGTFIIMWFYQASWVNIVMGWSMGIGLPNFFALISCDGRWRESYRDEKDTDRFERGAID